jgi:hypothetical protein
LKVQKPNWIGTVEVRDLIQRRPWSILSWSAGIIALAFIGYYGILSIGNPPADVGAQFVTAEFPPPSISPWFYGKPITWFIYAAFLYWSAGLEAQKIHFLKFSERTRRFLFIVTALVAFGAFYEIFYNFMIWSALEVLTQTCSPSPCSPDIISSRFPDLPKPLNLVFVTKVVVLVFSLSVYSLWFLYRIEKETERRNLTPSIAPSRRDIYDADTIKAAPMTQAFSFAVTTNGQYPPESHTPN